MTIHRDLPRRAEDLDDPRMTRAYYETRARQFMQEGMIWDGVISDTLGCPTAFFTRGPERFCSVYIPTHLRGQGMFRRVLGVIGLPVITVVDCHIEPALQAIGHPYLVVGTPILESPQYKIVQDFFGDQRDERSGVLLMNHIDEGIAVMRALGAPDTAIRAFCLTPLQFTSRNDIIINFHKIFKELNGVIDGIDSSNLALDYRALVDTNPVKVSTDNDVNLMLAGAVIQRKKDLLVHNWDHQANPEATRERFDQWIAALGIAHNEERLTAIINPEWNR